MSGFWVVHSLDLGGARELLEIADLEPVRLDSRKGGVVLTAFGDEVALYVLAQARGSSREKRPMLYRWRRWTQDVAVFQDHGDTRVRAGTQGRLIISVRGRPGWGFEQRWVTQHAVVDGSEGQLRRGRLWLEARSRRCAGSLLELGPELARLKGMRLSLRPVESRFLRDIRRAYRLDPAS